MNGYLVSADDRPGMTARLFEAVAARGVNVYPAFGLGDGTTGMWLVGSDDEAGLAAAISEAGLKAAPYEIVVTEVDNKPGAGAALFRKLADAGVDMRAIATLGTSGGRVQLAIAASDAALLKRTLGL